MAFIVQILLSSLTIGGVYSLIAYGYVLTYRVSEKLNLGQASSGVFGAFICLWLYHSGVPLFFGIIAGIVVAGLLGVLAERCLINPLRRSKIIGWLIAGLALEIALSRGLILWWGSDFKWFPSILGGERTITISGAAASSDKLLLIAVAVLVIFILETISDRTMWGRAMTATAYDRSGADLMGINTTAIVVSVFALSSSLCAIGVMLQSSFTNLYPHMGFELVIKGFVVAIIGGLRSRRGVIIAALIVGTLETLGALFAPAGYRDVLSFSVLVLVLIFRPQGLFGKVELREV